MEALNCGRQFLCAGLRRVCQHIGGGTILYDQAALHPRDALANLARDAQVMGVERIAYGVLPIVALIQSVCAARFVTRTAGMRDERLP